MKWHPFLYQGDIYDLSHLHSLYKEMVQDADLTKGYPKRLYKIVVEFSLHCFIKRREEGDDSTLAYSDNRETRTFCFERYALSKRLPDALRSIDQRPCYHTSRGNFLSIEFVDQSGQRREYEIYFQPSKTRYQGKPAVKLFVQSAYVRSDTKAQPRRAKRKKISAAVIVRNTLKGRPIREHP
jgi:hypothetical protein